MKPYITPPDSSPSLRASTTPPILTLVRWHFLGSLLWIACVVVLLSDTGIPLLLTMPFFYTLPLVLFGAIFFVGSLIYQAVRREKRLQAIRYLSLPLIVLLLCAVVAWLDYTHYGVVVRIKLAEQPLQSLVQSVQRGNAPKLPQQVGLFKVRRTEIRDGIVWIVTNETGFGNETGLVYSPYQEPPYISEDYYGHLIGPWWIWLRSW